MHILATASLKNRALIALVTVVIAIFGGIALTGLKQELMPSVQFPTIAVVTAYPGASPEVVNDDVSTPIEQALLAVPQLESTSATSSTNSSVVMATFEYGTDLVSTEQKIQQVLTRMANRLPEDLTPQVLSGGIDDLPVLQIAVTGGPGSDSEALADQLNLSAIKEISDIDGVREATLEGARGERITIQPDEEKLAAAGFTTQSIRDALQQNGKLIPGGEVVQEGKELAVQAGGKLTSAEDIAELPLVPTPAQLQQNAQIDQQEAAAAQAAEARLPGVTPGANQAQSEQSVPAPTRVVPQTIGEVAVVQLEANPVTSVSRVNGEAALTIAVTKLAQANTVEVSQEVRTLLPELEKTLDGIQFQVVFDQAPYIESSIETLAVEGLLGLVFAVLVILVFLLSVRATLVTAISIPVSVLITFIGLQASDYTLNILTLGALTISIGRVVDDSIVVIENIKRHLVEGEDRAVTIVRAVREVAGAITASTITTVAVFLPMAFVSGMTGELFRPFAMTITIALVASLLVSLTIVPVLAYWFVRPDKPRKLSRRAQAKALAAQPEETLGRSEAVPVAAGTGHGALPDPGSEPLSDQQISETEYEPSQRVPAPVSAGKAALLPATSMGQGRATAPEEAVGEERTTALGRGYQPIIAWTLKRPVVTLLAAVVLLGATLAAAPLMKTNFIGSDEQNSVSLSQTLAPGTSLEAQVTQAERVEEALLALDDVETVQVSLGASGGAATMFGGGGDGVLSYSITTNPDAVQAGVQDKIREAIGDLGPDSGELSLGAGGGFGMSSDIAINITAPSQESLAEASDAVLASVGDLDSVAQAESNLGTSRPFVQVRVDREKAAAAGFSEVALASIVSQRMQPSSLGQIILDEQSVNVYLVSADAPETIAELAALQIPTVTGEQRLDALATVTEEDGPVSVTTVQGSRSATVSATPAQDDLTVASTQVTQALAEIDLPPGVTAEIGGVIQQQEEAFGQLGLALLAAILIVYIVMVATFKSLLQPLLLLISVPFSATGAILLQIVSGVPLGVASLIGVLMLIGIVVTNAIVLVDLINQLRTRGYSLRDSVMLGSTRRLRPIIMTALATILALTPMAIGLTGHGGFISKPLAIVVIGGLISSTVLTLVVLPTLYFIVERAREQRAARRAERRGTGKTPSDEMIPASATPVPTVAVANSATQPTPEENL